MSWLRVDAHSSPVAVQVFVIVVAAGAATVGGIVGFLVGEIVTVHWPKGRAS